TRHQSAVADSRPPTPACRDRGRNGRHGFRMKTYTYSEARQNLAALLEEATRSGEVRIRRRDGRSFAIRPAKPKRSPLDVDGIETLCAVLAAGSLIVGLGVYDDILGADAPRKFTIQAAAAVILVAFGFRFDFVSLAGTFINFGVLASVISVVWIVGVINAMNFIDGM